VDADDQADLAQSVAVRPHVHRRHRHDRDHRDLGQHHHSRADHDTGPGRWGGARRATRVRGGPLEVARHQERVRAQQREQHRTRSQVRHRRQQERPRQRRHPHRPRQRTERLDQVRPRHRTERGRDHRDADRGAAGGRAGEVRTGVAGLQVRRRTCAVDEQSDEQQHDAAGDRRHHDADRADPARCEAEPDAEAPAVALGDPPDQERRERGSESEQSRRQPGQVVRAEHLLGEQRADGDARGEPCTAEHLPGDDDHEYPAL
jgi:hypothetical protein